MKTKHYFIGIFAILLSFANLTDTSAQLRFGLKGEVGLNNTTFKKSDLQVENLNSFSVGPTMEFMLPLAVVNLGVDAALLYNDNRMEVSNFMGGNNPTKQEVNNRYLKLPVNAKFKYPIAMLPLSLYAAAGPYAAYLISGDKIDFKSIEKDIEANKFEAGINIGVGAEVLKMLQVGFTYSAKLTDNYSLDKPEWDDVLNHKSGTWAISASLFF